MKLPAISRLTIEEIAGQLLMPALHIEFANRKSPLFQRTLRQLRRYQPGGFILFGGQPDTAADWINFLQQSSQLPLLFAADLERGVGGIFKGGTIFPQAMTLGAANNESLAGKMGEVIAREARAMGIQILFAPVLDLADQPGNPIVNIRGFHQNPEVVSRLGNAFIEAAQREGVACVAKHFPGHGSTNEDSHLTLPQLSRNLTQLSRRDLRPFRKAVQAGVKGIMTAHLLSPDGTGPASFSVRWVKNYLRKKMAFRGVVFTDALNMKAASEHLSPALQIRRALEAESDIFLMPPNLAFYFQTACRLINGEPQLKKKALESVERIFELKKWLGKNNAFAGNPGRARKFCQRPEHVGLSREIAELGMICLQNKGALPLNLRQIDSVAHFIFTDFSAPQEPLNDFNHLGREFFEKFTVKVNPEPQEVAFSNHRLTLISIYHRTFGGHQSRLDRQNLTACLNQLDSLETLLVAFLFGNPYPAAGLPDLFRCKAVFFSPGYTGPNQQAAFKALVSAIPVNGTLPVSLEINGKKARSISLPAVPTGLKPEAKKTPETKELSKIITSAIREKVFPGAVLLAAQKGEILIHEAYGTFSGEESPSPSAVKKDTVYDLASLTKVLATTPAILHLVHTGNLTLHWQLGDIYGLPDSHPLKAVTVEDLLAHQSGLPAWLPIYEKLEETSGVVEFILNLPLVCQPKSRAIYSDLGFILLGDIVELVSGLPLDVYCRNHLFQPMALHSLHFRPVPGAGGTVHNIPGRAIPPTGGYHTFGESRPGIVNDRNCYFLGGIAGHAGLFGNAKDVANMAWLFLNNGIRGENRFFSLELSRRATHPLSPQISARGLGWDTPTKPSSSGQHFSRSSFGHLAFTGPSLWVDREKDLVVVLLCNRTWESEENDKIRQFRPQLHDAVMKALRLV
ncbi:MAG: hypothetical protein Kow0037_06750 [Calditrichia bacterium]